MATDYGAMAEEMCSCMNPLVEMNEEIQELAQVGDTEAVGEMFSELKSISTEVEQCVLALEKKYGDMNTPEAEAKAKAAIKKECPKIAEIINQSETLE